MALFSCCCWCSSLPSRWNAVLLLYLCSTDVADKFTKKRLVHAGASCMIRIAGPIAGPSATTEPLTAPPPNERPCHIALIKDCITPRSLKMGDWVGWEDSDKTFQIVSWSQPEHCCLHGRAFVQVSDVVFVNPAGFTTHVPLPWNGPFHQCSHGTQSVTLLSDMDDATASYTVLGLTHGFIRTFGGFLFLYGSDMRFVVRLCRTCGMQHPLPGWQWISMKCLHIHTSVTTISL